MTGSDKTSGPFFIPKTGGTLYMADDKNIKTPDIPAADTGPGTRQPQASKAEPEKQEQKTAPLPEADKKPEPETAAPNVSVYNFSEIMKGKKAEERSDHTSSPASPEKGTIKETEKMAASGKSEKAPTKEVSKADIPDKAEKTAEKQEPPKRRGRPPKETASKETVPKKEPVQKTGKAPAPKKAKKESEVKKEPPKKEVSKGSVSAAPPEKTAGKAPEKPQGAPRRGKEQIVYIKLDDLHAFKNHPFEVRDDEEMRAMVSSVKDKGVTQPAIVRPREDGGYEIVSGHRRQKASELAGYADMPCIVRNLTDDEAITQMVEDNLNQREEILPSERAKALKMQLEAIKHQGSRTSDQIDPKDAGKRSNEIVAERNKMAVKQVQRYIRLNELVPDLMKLMDEKKLGFTTAVELSYISKKNQNYIAVAVDSQQSSPSQAQAKRMRELDEKKLLNGDVIDGIMMEDKKEVDKVILTGAELGKYFGKETTPREMKDQIIKLLDDWKGQQKAQEKPDKKTEKEK